VGMIAGKDLDENAYKTAIDKFQEKWVNSTEEVIQGSSDTDILTLSRSLREKYRTQLDNWAQRNTP